MFDLIHCILFYGFNSLQFSVSGKWKGKWKWKTNISNIRNINFKNKKYNVNI